MWWAPAVAAEDDRTVAFARLLVRDDEILVGDAIGRYRELLATEGRERGLDVPRSSSVFGATDTPDADLHVGASLSVSCGGRPRACELTAAWEVLDTRSGAVVYATETRNQVPTPLAAPPAPTELERRLLEGALDRLLAKPGFQETVHGGTPTGEAAATWTGPLQAKRCGRTPLSLPSQLPDAVQSVVVVAAGGRSGSGVTVSPDGTVLTAAHVVGDARTARVTLAQGLDLEATVVRSDHRLDVAVLDLPGGGHACAPVEAGEVALGASLFAIGAPLGSALSASVSRGIASATRAGELDGVRLLQTDAALSPGNSGGPLLGESGAVVAIVSFKLVGQGVDGLGFGVVASDVLSRLEIELGDLSSADPMALSGTRGAPPAELRTDPPDASGLVLGPEPQAPRTPRPPAAPREPIARWTPGERRTVGIWSGVAAAGAVIAGSSYAAGSSANRLRGWKAASVSNAVGWSVAATAAAVALGAAGQAHVTPVPR